MEYYANGDPASFSFSQSPYGGRSPVRLSKAYAF